jgi:hypothetical protein
MNIEGVVKREDRFVENKWSDLVTSSERMSASSYKREEGVDASQEYIVDDRLLFGVGLLSISIPPAFVEVVRSTPLFASGFGVAHSLIALHGDEAI